MLFFALSVSWSKGAFYMLRVHRVLRCRTLSQWRAELAAQRDETQRLEEAEAGGAADASSAAAAAAAEVARQARLKVLAL